jgi:hypothetical protein
LPNGYQGLTTIISAPVPQISTAWKRVALGVDDTERAARALKGAKGKRLTYQTTR